jgi:hypothetical protein
MGDDSIVCVKGLAKGLMLSAVLWALTASAIAAVLSR